VANKSLTLQMSCFAYQANLQYREKTPRLPRGFKRISVVESPSNARIGFIAESSSIVVIAFRGTVDLGDLQKDLSATQVKFPYSRQTVLTHKGFTELYRVLRPGIFKTLHKVRTRKPVHVTGHSLGGALAALCALDLALNRQGLVKLYTFGSPKAGNSAFATAIRKRVKSCFRIYNTEDLVTRLPPPSFLAYRYEHAGNPVPLTFSRSNPLTTHSISAYVRALCKESAEVCKSVCAKGSGFCP
jgi:triacylglycerol lipase